jgi:triacylglycerol esterase/lipase EstA (alpha/beta hydrolase family)
MITRLTRLLIVLQLVAALGLCIALINIWHVHNVVAASLIGIGLVIIVRMTIIANNFYIASRYRNRSPDTPRLSLRQFSYLFGKEFFSSMLSSTWSMAFCSFEKRIADNPAGLPVLLIHGYGCNSGYWHPMSRALSRANITHYAIDLEPVFADIDDYVASIERALDMLRAETGHSKAIIVAHSMGGLVTRAYLRKYGARYVAKIITLGTPHRGTGLANFGKGLNSRQMQWQGNAAEGSPSDWLKRLEESETLETRALFVSIYSHHDNIVSPQISSHLNGATNIELSGIGHVSLAFNPLVQKTVIKEILAVSGS